MESKFDSSTPPERVGLGLIAYLKRTASIGGRNFMLRVVWDE